MKVSILTACHNNAPHLAECITSMMKQEYRHFQWIIVDDHSTDNSYKILKGIKDSRVEVVRNAERMFCSSTYNNALKRANGDICAILDADDLLPGNAIKDIVIAYKTHPKLGYIYTQHMWCDAKIRKKRKGLSSLPKHGMSFVDMTLKSGRHCFSHWRTFRTELAKHGTIFPAGLKYAVDKHMGFALEELAPGGFWPRALYFYRYHKKNMSLTVPQKQKSLWKKMAKEYKDRRDSNNLIVYPVIGI